jgi:hypothetical protein
MAETKASSKSTKEKPRKMTAKEQSARFIETARELEADETGKAFRDATDRLLKVRAR